MRIRHINEVDTILGNLGNSYPGSVLELYLFRRDLLTILKLRALARGHAVGVPQVPQFAGFLRSPQRGFPINRKVVAAARRQRRTQARSALPGSAWRAAPNQCSLRSPPQDPLTP
jgi:hypothetical protein